MQKTLGQLCEAVAGLKERVKSHDVKLDTIGKDIHGAKVGGKVLGWVVGVAGTLIAGAIGFVGWAIKTYMAASK